LVFFFCPAFFFSSSLCTRSRAARLLFSLARVITCDLFSLADHFNFL
jgi:hypothetical protein